jgi:hypothetical protein
MIFQQREILFAMAPASVNESQTIVVLSHARSAMWFTDQATTALYDHRQHRRGDETPGSVDEWDGRIRPGATAAFLKSQRARASNQRRLG